MRDLLSIDVILFLLTSWLALGAVSLCCLRYPTLITRVIFPCSALISLALTLTSLFAVSGSPELAILPLGLPQLPFHLRLDALSAYFLLILGIVSCAVSLFSAGYFRQGEETPNGLISLEYHVLLASMALLLLAADAYVFLLAWEGISLAATLLVSANHKLAEVRSAAFLYLLISHIGGLALLIGFSLLQGHSGDYTFSGMRHQHLDMFWASCSFFLLLFGFGAKAGILPLHIWLPEAHPAAPSPISALMSAVVLKTGIYGVLRCCFDVLHVQVWWWGGATLALGLATALFGVVLCAVQTDMKRLLAYSSIENIGLMFVGIGLSILFRAYGMAELAALALTASLYHAASHSAFKSLLFLGTGTVLHATGERSLGGLGGLLRCMPWTGWLMLLGALAAAGLPPLGGFVSEWLLLQSFLFTQNLPNSFLNMLIPIVAAVIALVGALAAYVMVKFFGIIFLGQSRESRPREPHDANPWERSALLLLGATCLAYGLLPVQMLHLIAPVTDTLLGHSIIQPGASWLLLVPVDAERASYMPVAFVLTLVTCCLLTYALVKRHFHAGLRRAPPWACGHPFINARMQDSAEGFGMPIREMFGSFLRIQRELPSASDTDPYYKVTVEDPFWLLLYRPVARYAELLSALAGRLQHGRISIYLLYSFLTLLLLLLVVRP